MFFSNFMLNVVTIKEIRTLEDLKNHVRFATCTLSFVSSNIKWLYPEWFLSKWWKIENLILYYFHNKSSVYIFTTRCTVIFFFKWYFLPIFKWNFLINNLSLYTKAIIWKIMPSKAKETITFIAAKKAYKIMKIWNFNFVVFSIYLQLKKTYKDMFYHFGKEIS